jgi:hypothetical protein
MTWTRRTFGRRPRRKELRANAAAFRRRWGNSAMILWWNVAWMSAAEIKSAPGEAQRSVSQVLAAAVLRLPATMDMKRHDFREETRRET